MDNYAYILSIGNEVTSGSVVNFNASIIAQNLASIGVETKKVITIEDDRKAICDGLSEFMASGAKVLVVTGGLGPTHDDFTKEVIASFFGLELKESSEAKEHMRNFFGKDLKDSNLKQIYMPEDSIVIENKLGSADGFILNIEGKVIIVLVGPTFEMEPMFNDSCIPYLKNIGKEFIVINYTLVGKSESELENILIDIETKYEEVSLCSYCNNGKIRYCLKALKINEDKLNEIKKKFIELCKDYIISDENEEVEEVLVRILKEKKLTISFSESMTGGLLSSLITSVSGASEVISQSFVTYSSDAKHSILGVNIDTINKFDVVSKNVANEMVLGLANKCNASVCVSVTGYAGPTGKDIGKVCYAIKYKGSINTYEEYFKGTRSMIRARAARKIMYEVIRVINNER